MDSSGLGSGPDLRVQKGARCLTMAIKAPAEGRADRVIPLLAQAILQAQHYAHSDTVARPLAVVYVEEASSALIGQAINFADQYARGTAIGIVARSGQRHFHGADLEELNAEPPSSLRRKASTPSAPVNLFSDLNQWMLKVLLAPDLPEDLLTAPRARFRTGAEFAKAAGVSTMSASRLLQQLRSEGHLHDASPYLTVVRREELLQRWRAASMRTPIEVPMRFVIKASPEKQLRDLLASHPTQACLGLFSAANALHLGHVSGVPPHVYVPRLSRLDDRMWRSLVPLPSGAPDLIVREAAAPQSTFRGTVIREGVACADVIQTWLDVASHPARGDEQADLIYRQILRPRILEGSP